MQKFDNVNMILWLTFNNLRVVLIKVSRLASTCNVIFEQKDVLQLTSFLPLNFFHGCSLPSE